MITLHDLTPDQRRHRYKRVGRGNSSGKGTTAGRGTKGQRARTGGRNKLTRRGLQHLIVRTPKVRGFRSRREKFESVNLQDLQRFFADGAVITPQAMQEQGLIRHLLPGVKVLAGGTLTKKFTVKAQKFSVTASAAITKVGGTVTTITIPSRVVPKKQRP